MRSASIAAVTLLLVALGGCGREPDPGARGRAAGVGPSGGEAEIDVVFSPQPADRSHNTRVAELIDGAERSIDIRTGRSLALKHARTGPGSPRSNHDGGGRRPLRRAGRTPTL